MDLEPEPEPESESEPEPEPGRCQRTDGKKWCCSRDVVAGTKYCQRHVNRGRGRSKRSMENPKPSIPGSSGRNGGGGVLQPNTPLASQFLAVMANGTYFNVSRPSPSIDIVDLNQSMQKEKKKGDVVPKERKPNWTKEEDEALCKAWLRVSDDPSTFDGRARLWDRVRVEYDKILGCETERCSSGLMYRWSVIQAHLNKYAGFVRTIERIPTRDYSVEELIGAAKQLYYSSEGHYFKWDGCWLLLKDATKWLNYKEQQESKKQKIAQRKRDFSNADLDQTADSSDPPAPSTTPGLNAGSVSVDDENSALAKESHELPRSPVKIAAENVCLKKNADQLGLEAAVNLFFAEFSNLRKEQKEIAEQEAIRASKREELIIQAKQEQERQRTEAKLEQERMKIASAKFDHEQMMFEKEIMFTDPKLVPTEEGKAWVIAQQKAILARTIQGGMGDGSSGRGGFNQR